MLGVMSKEGEFAEIFRVEMDGWAYGLANYPGEIFPELVFRVVRELEPCFVSAIQNGYVFNILELGANFSRAAKYLVHEKDIIFCILSVFPTPSRFDEDGQFVMANVIDQVEQAYGGALERLEKKWRFDSTYQDEIKKLTAGRLLSKKAA